MKYSPDAYLLYESSKFITYNIRIKVVLKDLINPTTLKEAGMKAFERFPYFHKQIHIDEKGGIDFIYNPRGISVNPVTKKRASLFSKETNYQPCSIEYEDNCVYFNMYHGMCGGSGTFRWLKTTIYEYVTKEYGLTLNGGSTLLTSDPIVEEEYAYPQIEMIPDTHPVHSEKTDEVWFPKLDYLVGFANLFISDSIHHEFRIPKKEMLRYMNEIEGSPMSILTAVNFKALKLALPKETMPLRGKSNHNFASKVGCAKTHHDLLLPLYYFIPNEALDWPIEKLCTIIRGMTFLQSQDEYVYERTHEFNDVRSAIDECVGYEEKKKYASEHSFYKTSLHSSFNINYIGKEDWGDLLQYVDQTYVITDGHLLMEVTDVGDYFCISYMQMAKNKTYLECIFKVLDEIKIPYEYMGSFNNHLCSSNVEKAPIQ